MATWFIRPVSGSDANGGASHEDAWQHLYYALAHGSVAAGDHFNVQGEASIGVEDGSEDCILLIDKLGAPGLPFTWEGYSSTPQDGGFVTLDASINSLTNCIRFDITAGGNGHHAFKNFRFTGCSGQGGAGIYLPRATGADPYCTFLNCQIDHNNKGAEANRHCKFIRCLIEDNDAIGIDGANYYTQAAYCIIRNNGGGGVQCVSGGNVVGNLLYNNGTTGNAIMVDGGTNHSQIIAYNTIDGDDEAGFTGIQVDGPDSFFVIVVNNIIFNCGTGINFEGSGSNRFHNFVGYNYYFSNDTPVSGDCPAIADQIGSIDGGINPFTNSAARDYSLPEGSPARNAGLDIAEVLNLFGA